MTPSEFQTTVLQELFRRVPGLRDWLHGLDANDPSEENRKRKPIGSAIVKAWRGHLEDVDALEVVSVIADIAEKSATPLGESDLDRELIGASLRAAVRHRRWVRESYAKEAKPRERASSEQQKADFLAALERLKSAKVKEIAYTCLLCYDGGYIWCWHPDALCRLAADPKYLIMERGGQFMALCGCEKGDERNRKAFPLYEGDKMARIDINLSDEENLSHTRKWIALRTIEQLKRLEELHAHYSQKDF